MVAFRAFAFFALLLCCSASRSNHVGYSHRYVKQHSETKLNAREALEAGISRRDFWMALLVLLSASGGNAFVPAATPGRSRPQLHSPRLNVSMSMQQLPRRAVLAGALLGLALPRPDPGAAALSDEQRKQVERDNGLREPRLQDGGITTKQIQGLRFGRKELTKKQVQKVKSVIDLFDKESGIVKAEEISGALRALGYPEEDVAKVMHQVTQTISERGGYPDIITDKKSSSRARWTSYRQEVLKKMPQLPEGDGAISLDTSGMIDSEDFVAMIIGMRDPLDPNGFPMREDRRKSAELEQIKRWNAREDMMKAATGREVNGKIAIPLVSDDSARISTRWVRPSKHGRPLSEKAEPWPGRSAEPSRHLETDKIVDEVARQFTKTWMDGD